MNPAIEQAMRAGQYPLALQLLEADEANTVKDSLALLYWGVALRELGFAEQASEKLLSAFSLRPSDARIANNLGLALNQIGDFIQARHYFEKALALDSHQAAAWNNMGRLLIDMGQPAEACAALDCALQLKPKYPLAQWNLAQAYLMRGDYESGWKLANARKQLANWQDSYPCKHTQPVWDGGNGDDVHLLVHDEQGYGDTLQFLRFVPLLKDKVKVLTLEVRQPLTRLVCEMPGMNRVVERGSAPRDITHVCALMDLPEILSIRLNNLPDAPYLRAPTASRSTSEKLRIGIAWQGRALHDKDALRSVPIEVLDVLSTVNDVEWVSLQQSDSPHPSWLPSLLQGDCDFLDLARLIESVDLVISVDSACAHLAGAMGKPVWLLCPEYAEWRWLLHREDSPWYSSMRLFRQDAEGWEGLLERASIALTTWRDSVDHGARAENPPAN